MSTDRPILRTPRRMALIVIAALVATASLVSFAESYRGLYLWALRHALTGFWAYAWPLQVDVFIAVGELTLLVALIDRWPLWARLGAWIVTGLGLAVSVAGNVGHVTSHSLTSRGTAAVPPLAAAAALAVGLGVLKRTVEAHAVTHPETPPVTAPETVPAVAQQRDSDETGPRGTVRRLVAADPDVSAGKLAKATGVSRSTAARWKRTDLEHAISERMAMAGNGKAH